MGNRPQDPIRNAEEEERYMTLLKSVKLLLKAKT
jgi:hypothetical protein